MMALLGWNPACPLVFFKGNAVSGCAYLCILWGTRCWVPRSSCQCRACARKASYFRLFFFFPELSRNCCERFNTRAVMIGLIWFHTIWLPKNYVYIVCHNEAFHSPRESTFAKQDLPLTRLRSIK
jgi:hypothetical protein